MSLWESISNLERAVGSLNQSVHKLMDQNDELQREVDELRRQLRGQGHKCQRYFCPQSGSIETVCCSGFDHCCDSPQQHIAERGL